MKKYFLFAFILMFSACGYKPMVNVTKESLKGNVYIEVPIDIKNINNSIFIKESLIKLFSNEFKLKVVDQKSLGDLLVTGKLLSLKHEALESESGYASLYRESVTISVKYYKKNLTSKTIIVSDYADYTVDDVSIINKEKQNAAIKEAITNAISGLNSQIAISVIQANAKK